MKTCLLNLALLSESGAQSKIPDSYSKFVQSNIGKLECRFKVLGSPLELIKDAYQQLVRDGNQEDFELILTVRGVQKKDFTNYKLVNEKTNE
jgi:hypothetical protein